jgi:hypothetical protein
MNHLGKPIGQHCLFCMYFCVCVCVCLYLTACVSRPGVLCKWTHALAVSSILNFDSQIGEDCRLVTGLSSHVLVVGRWVFRVIIVVIVLGASRLTKPDFISWYCAMFLLSVIPNVCSHWFLAWEGRYMAPAADEYPYRVIPTISNCQGLYSTVKFFWLPSKHTHTHTHTHTH